MPSRNNIEIVISAKDDASATLSTVGNKMQSIGGSLSNVGGAVMTIAAPLAGAFGIAVKQFQDVLGRPEARVLDLACGSGDLVMAMGGDATKAMRIGGDFSHGMLKAAKAKLPTTPLVEADALQLPLAANSLDLITIGFGFRNLANYRAGCVEMLRVLKPGGQAAILEFSTPPNALFRGFYNWYSFQVLPRIGALLSGGKASNAYKYLPASVKKFPDAPDLASLMKSAGFAEVRYERMTFGIVALHIGRKA